MITQHAVELQSSLHSVWSPLLRFSNWRDADIRSFANFVRWPWWIDGDSWHGWTHRNGTESGIIKIRTLSANLTMPESTSRLQNRIPRDSSKRERFKRCVDPHFLCVWKRHFAKSTRWRTPANALRLAGCQFVTTDLAGSRTHPWTDSRSKRAYFEQPFRGESPLTSVLVPSANPTKQ